SDCDRGENDHLEGEPARIVAQRGKNILAQRDEIKRAGPGSEDGTARESGDERNRGLRQAAVDETAHQPIEAVVESKRRGGEGQEQARASAGGKRDGDAGEEHGRRFGAAAGKQDHDRQSRKGARGTSGREDEGLGGAKPISGEDG